MLATELHAWLKGRRLSANVYDEVISLKLFTWGILLFEAEYKCSLEDALTAFRLTYDTAQTRRVRPGDMIVYETGEPRQARVFRVEETFANGHPPHAISSGNNDPKILTDLLMDPGFKGIVLGTIGEQFERGKRLLPAFDPDTDAEREGYLAANP